MNILDGNWMVLRNFHMMNKPQDESVLFNSCLGSILKFIKDYGYDNKFVVAWDDGKYRYRSDTKGIDYKGERNYDESFQSAWNTMKRLQEVLPFLGVASLKFKGIEADDIGYFFAHHPKFKRAEKRLLASDRDWFISITEDTMVIRPMPRGPEYYTNSILEEEYELEHYSEFLLYKAINGDGSDSIPGLTGSHSKIKKLMLAHKLDKLTEEQSTVISNNIHLMRLDRIIEDQEVCDSLLEQFYHKPTKTPLSFLLPPNHPAYFTGVIKKYMTRQGLA